MVDNIDLKTSTLNNNIQCSETRMQQTRAKLSEIDSKSSIWTDYKKYDTNNNGTLTDDNISETELFKLGQNFGIFSDGKINDIKQQEANDCWLLSSVKALEQTSAGGEAIKNAIDANHTGTSEDPYEVTIYNTLGEKQTIKITEEDLNEKGYSKGDFDMNLLEAATEKYFDSEGIAAEDKSQPDSSISGKSNNIDKYSPGYMLTGKTGTGLTTGEILEKNKEYYKPLTKDGVNEMLTDFANNQKSNTLTFSFKESSLLNKLFSSKNNPEQIPNHVYYVKDVIKDDNGKLSDILYVNPWDTSQVYHKSYDDFCKNIAQIEKFEL